MEIPDGGMHLWEWFWDMSRDRRSSDGGLDPIGLAGIAVWSQMTGNAIRPDEVGIVRDMDDAFRSAHAAEMADQQRRRRAEADMEAKRKRGGS